MTRLKAFLKQGTQLVENHDLRSNLRPAAALVSIVAISLPWLTLDGASAALNGGELVAYSLTSPERSAMIETSFIGGTALLIGPPMLITMAVLVFFKTISGAHSAPLNITIAGLAIFVVAVTGELTSTDHAAIGKVTVPDWGLLGTILPQLGLAAHTGWLRYYKEGDESATPKEPNLYATLD